MSKINYIEWYHDELNEDEILQQLLEKDHISMAQDEKGNFSTEFKEGIKYMVQQLTNNKMKETEEPMSMYPENLDLESINNDLNQLDDNIGMEPSYAGTYKRLEIVTRLSKLLERGPKGKLTHDISKDLAELIKWKISECINEL